MTIAQIEAAVKAGLSEGINELAREMGIIKRQSKITGQALVQGLVFGYLANPQASESEIAQSVGRAGAVVTAQAVNAKLTQATSVFLQKVLEQVVQQVVQPKRQTQSLLDRFSEVNVQDSTTISLPNELSEWWAGCGNRTDHGQAGLKIQVQWDLRSGALKHLTLQQGRENDRSAAVQTAEVVAGSLRLADLGYFDLKVFNRIGQAQAYWLTRYLTGVHLFDGADTGNGEPLDLPRWLDAHCSPSGEVEATVLVGDAQRLPARLLALRVPQSVADERRRKLRDDARGKGQTVSARALALAAWTIVLTNVPQDKLSFAEGLIILHARWQIELLFKLWKSAGRIDESRSHKPFRQLCELFAKLIAQVIQHWLIIATAWTVPDRSLFKAAAAVRACATSLLLALRAPTPSAAHTTFRTTLSFIVSSLPATARISKRNLKPALFQLLAIPIP